ncbi:hypothetical protein L1987_58391 [Smallanthus sonchifolius]|uniref:Uncharacterized protein n=1 Tax=Smallanthus sonchifolius TaxID=185202 RepID=A0ACB9DFL7_9ASTR|nr:hypothetical protein L1987_58391 [Smallanthus sonchifolius]
MTQMPKEKVSCTSNEKRKEYNKLYYARCKERGKRISNGSQTTQTPTDANTHTTPLVAEIDEVMLETSEGVHVPPPALLPQFSDVIDQTSIRVENIDEDPYNFVYDGPLDNYRVPLNASVELDQRVYSRPTTSELETSRLQLCGRNQAKIRSDLYQGIVDCVNAGEVHPNRVGQQVVLPASFIGWPRDMRRRFLDAMTFVQDDGKPDLFITMTCNPQWPEISDNLKPGQIEQDRPELVSRVFRAKLEDLKEQLFKKHLIGEVKAYGDPKSCRFRYPRQFNELTTQGDDAYPLYRRRNNGINVNVRGKNLDNRWVVRYNPRLLMMFSCHMNVEVCSSIKSVKYLFKYVYKGHDKQVIQINPDEQGVVINEIKRFQDARYVSPPEAMWHIFSFSLSQIHPPVLALQLHLPNKQMVRFNDDDIMSEIVDRERDKITMLTSFFETNRVDATARQFLYKDFPKHFTWNSRTRRWNRRIAKPQRGRIVSANPAEGERFYLRPLLPNVKGPASFEDLCTVNGVTYTTFQKAALEIGLLENDDSLSQCLTEASLFQFPSALRRLFATIMIFCEPGDVRKLWNDHFESLSEDHRLQCQSVEQDEASMAKRLSIEVVDRTLQDITGVSLPFGGKIMVMGGDFRQVLPVIKRGTRAQIVVSSLRMSPLWSLTKKMRLTINMRALNDLWFFDFLLRVGDGTEVSIEGNFIRIPDDMTIPCTNRENSINELIKEIFPSITNKVYSSDYIISRAILCTKNESVDEINDQMIDIFQRDEKVYYSFDEAEDDHHNFYPTEFLNSLNVSEIVVGQHIGKRVFLPRIPLCLSEDDMFPFKLKRKQFPIRLSFSMTINKAQGQTIPHVGVYLPDSVFSHGQLYVALSRGISRENTKVLIHPSKDFRRDGVYTSNVVYREVLHDE